MSVTCCKGFKKFTKYLAQQPFIFQKVPFTKLGNELGNHKCVPHGFLHF